MPLDVLFTPEPDDWSGARSIQLRLRDLRETRHLA
jgi:hypothetical protein